MYAGKDFSDIAPEEEINLSFDYTRDLSQGEKLVSATWTCEVESGDDPNPQSHVMGSATINDSVEFDLPDVVATQRIAGLLNGVKYRFTSLATTDQAQVLELFSFAVCKARTA